MPRFCLLSDFRFCQFAGCVGAEHRGEREHAQRRLAFIASIFGFLSADCWYGKLWVKHQQQIYPAEHRERNNKIDKQLINHVFLSCAPEVSPFSPTTCYWKTICVFVSSWSVHELIARYQLFTKLSFSGTRKKRQHFPPIVTRNSLPMTNKQSASLVPHKTLHITNQRCTQWKDENEFKKIPLCDQLVRKKKKKRDFHEWPEHGKRKRENGNRSEAVALK